MRGSKSINAKDRVAAVICVNADGSCKIPPLLVGTAKQPNCFRDEPCPLPYTNQASAWCDRKVYQHWFHKVFLPAIRAWTKERVVLIMDNCSGHDPDCTDPQNQVVNYNRFRIGTVINGLLYRLR